MFVVQELRDGNAVQLNRALQIAHESLSALVRLSKSLGQRQQLWLELGEIRLWAFEQHAHGFQIFDDVAQRGRPAVPWPMERFLEEEGNEGQVKYHKICGDGGHRSLLGGPLRAVGKPGF